MVKTKQSRFNSTKATLIIASLALVAALASLLYVTTVDQNTRLWSRSASEGDFSQQTQQARFEYCYDNNIRPCDDIAIDEFNKKQEAK